MYLEIEQSASVLRGVDQAKNIHGVERRIHTYPTYMYTRTRTCARARFVDSQVGEYIVWDVPGLTNE